MTCIFQSPAKVGPVRQINSCHRLVGCKPYQRPGPLSPQNNHHVTFDVFASDGVQRLKLLLVFFLSSSCVKLVMLPTEIQRFSFSWVTGEIKDTL